jgi:hypothetical protein
MLDDPQILADRIRSWWAVYVLLASIVGAIIGGFGVALTKFTIYYLAEQTSVSSLANLETLSAEASSHLKVIDNALVDQKYVNQATTKELADLNKVVGSLADERAQIGDALAKQNKNSETILLLLQQKPPPPPQKGK